MWTNMEPETGNKIARAGHACSPVLDVGPRSLLGLLLLSRRLLVPLVGRARGLLHDSLRDALLPRRGHLAIIFLLLSLLIDQRENDKATNSSQVRLTQAKRNIRIKPQDFKSSICVIQTRSTTVCPPPGPRPRLLPKGRSLELWDTIPGMSRRAECPWKDISRSPDG